MYFCERRDKDNYVEIGNESFFSRLKDLPKRMQILLYIHGFNNTAEAEVFPRTEKLQELFDKVGVKDLVHVVPLIWPCDNDNIVSIIDDYWDDQRAADQSGAAFARMLGKFDDWRKKEAQGDVLCTKRMNVLAHSMGNRVLRNALTNWVEYDTRGQMPQLFRNVFMVAPDVVNHALEREESGQYIPDSARNVVVYYANDDLAMPASKVANLKNLTVSRRLGMTGPEDLDAVPKNVYEVDCDNFNNTFDPPVGHAYFLTGPRNAVSPVLKHMVQAIKTGRVTPNERHHELSRS